MKSTRRNLFIFIFVFLFASAVWCASLASPGQALVSVTGCSQNSGTMEMTGCEQFFCGFDSSSNVLSQGAVSSARSHDSLKGALGVAVGEASTALSHEGMPLGWREFTNAFPVRADKVSIRLFNSVLNL